MTMSAGECPDVASRGILDSVGIRNILTRPHIHLGIIGDFLSRVDINDFP